VSLKVAKQALSIGIAFLLLSACTATRNSLIDVKATIEPSSSEKAYKAIVLALLDKGFDLKMNDRDLRVTTTEYKKFSSVSGWPPFDFYLQVKAVVRDTPDGKYQIALTPKIKEQNRINASAFTEHSLIIYSDKEQKEDYATHSGRGKAMLEGQLLFLSIVQAIADVLALPAEQFKQNLQQAEVFGM
jgi:hypothetical protein